MRTIRVSRSVLAVVVVGFSLALGLFAGCSDDEEGGGVVGPGPSPITVREILFTPNSVGPGDTLLLTAVVSSETPNIGDFVTLDWTLTGGEFLDEVTSDQSSVRWRAPADGRGLYSFSVTATNSTNSSTLSGEVFVGRLEPFITERGGTLVTVQGSDAVFYTSGSGEPEDGFALRFKDGAIDEVAYPNHQGTQFSFDASGMREAHTYVERKLYAKTTVVFDDLVTRTHKTVGRDERTFSVRWSQFTHPYMSLDGQWVCFQGALLAPATPAQGGVDTFAVFVHEAATEKTRRATFRGNSKDAALSKSYYPTMSSDNKYVVFISDRDGPGVWEYFALPIGEGGVVPDTVPDALIKLTSTGGKVTSEEPIPTQVVARQWNPDPANPTLASVGADKKLRLIQVAEVPIVIVVTLQGDADDVRWAPSGQFLVASATGRDNLSRIYRVSASGEVSPALWVGELPGDKIRNLSVSPDGGAMVYSTTRGQKLWYEFIETDRTEDDRPATRISPSLVIGGAAEYGPPLQSLRPAWARNSTRVAYLAMLDKDTPRVMISRDLSAIGD